MVVRRVHVLDDDLAQLAAGAGDEDDPVTGLDGLGHRPAGADRLVVGMSVDGHEGQASISHRLNRSALGPPAAGRTRRCHRSEDTISGPAATIAACPARSPARSPACVSSTARPSSPARTARCSWPISAPTSSRSSHPRATPRAAGARRGSASEADGTRTAAYYLAVNRNKRSIRLDLRTPEGATVLRRLPRRRRRPRRELPDRAASRGSGSTTTTLAALNPRLVHLAISGYGPDGPGRRPARATTSSSRPSSGLMSITGDADADGGQPTKVGVAISDVVTGLLGAVGVLAGAGWPRAGGGAAGRRGQRIDVSLLGVDAGGAHQPGPERLRRAARRPARRGNAHPNIVPYETFATADGEIAVAVGSERQWPRFCEAIGLRELADDPAVRHERRPRRRTGRSCGRSSPSGSLTRTTADWLAALDGGRRPGRPDQRRPRGLRVARGARARDDRRGRASRPRARSARSASRSSFAHAGARSARAPPLLGEHTRRGPRASSATTRRDIERLRAAGVV